LRSTSSMVTSHARRAIHGAVLLTHVFFSLLLPIFVIAAQHAALQEEVRRRREECIQLKAVLLQQSQSMRSLEPESLQMRGNDVNELMEAFHSQKLINR